MGQFPTNPGYITRAQTWIPTNTINSPSAWLFENQSGTLGTNLTGSVVYVGTAGTVKVIVAGTLGKTATVTKFTLISGGTGYTSATGVATTPTNKLAPSEGKQLTFDITASAGVITGLGINEHGIDYRIGDIITIAQVGSGLNATIRVDEIRGYLPESNDGIEFKNVAAGTILPVVVDYVLVPSSGAATDIIVGK